jgi:1,2-diacylglycerol-3-alpha-glucose alpha-1,2-galactosyltransferase
MKVHVVSETAYMIKGNGVHTAFVDHVELLNSKKDVETVVNNEGRGDVMHSHTYGPYYFFKGLRYKHKRVFTAHVIPDSIKGSIPAWNLWMPFVKWYMKQVYSYSDVCIAISPRVEEAIIESGAHTHIERIYNPIPVDRWQCTPEKRKQGRKLLGLSDHEFVVLGVGQLQARKGVEDFMDVAKAVPDAKFVWAGGRPFGPLTEGIARIDSRISESEGSNIQFTGMLGLDQMPLIYAAADLMLFTSYQENCPLAPIEGAASGLPVVFRNIQEYHSLYEHPYLKATTTEDFIQLTRKMMTDEDFLEQGKAVSKLLITQFDKNVIREKLLHIYEYLYASDTQTSRPKLPSLQTT